MKNVLRLASLLGAAVMLFASCGETGTATGGETPDNPDVPVNGELTLEVDKLIIQAGVDQAKLTVKFNDQPITEDVTIFDSKNKPIDLGSDFIFTSETEGEYSFWANYKTFNSNKVYVTVVATPVPETPADPQPSNTSFVRRVLLTKVTGAGCVACPNVTAALHYFFHGNDEAVPATEPHELAPYVVKAEAHTYEGGYDPAQLSGFYSASL